MSTPRYRLGIDLGTTYTAAALSRAHGRGWGEPEIVALGSRSASVASVLYLGAPEPDGSEPFLVGDAAERRAHSEPDRVVRQFKRRVGDDVPLVVGDAVHTAQDLAARMARWVVEKVAEREGGPADLVAITHPASWGDHKRELLAGALHDAGLTSVTFLPEPQAAAVAYAAKERVDVGGTVAVYDLGGGTFDAAVVRRTAAGFELPGRPEGIEQLGGVDFDDRVFSHVLAGLGAAFDDIDPEDPDVVSAVTRLRRECVEAKEALSADTAVSIPVMLPSLRTDVRLTRHEFEAMIRASLDHTVAALRRTVESASLAPEDLQAVLLVGGSSRIPLVAQMVSEDLGRPVAVDTDPKTAIAVGAVLAIAPRPEPVRRTATPRAAAEPVVNAADAAAATSTLARGAAGAAAAARGDTDSGLIDLRGQAGAAAPVTPPGPVRTGPPSGPLPAVGPPSGRLPATGPPSGRGPVTGPPSGGFVPGPRSGRLPVDPSGRFAAQHDGRSRPGPGVPATEDETRTVRHYVGGLPPRPPVAAGGTYPARDAEQPPATPRSRTRLAVMVAAAVALVAALTTGGVVYARSATVSATLSPPTSTSVPPPVPPEPTDAAAVGNASPVDVAGGGGGGGGSGGSAVGSGSGGSSSGGSWGGSSGGHHPTTTTTTTTTTTSRKVATTSAAEPSGQASN